MPSPRFVYVTNVFFHESAPPSDLRTSLRATRWLISYMALANLQSNGRWIQLFVLNDRPLVLRAHPSAASMPLLGKMLQLAKPDEDAGFAKKDAKPASPRGGASSPRGKDARSTMRSAWLAPYALACSCRVPL